jgi:hypothetical protein
MKSMLWIEDVIESTPTPPFLTNSRIDMVGFVDPTRWLLKGVHFQPFQVHKMKMKTKDRKNHEKKKRPKVNLIFSHVNHNFLILDLGIEPQTFRHSLEKKCFFEWEERSNVKKGPMQGSICFKLVPGLLVLRPLFKVGMSFCPLPKNNPQILKCI